METSNLTDLNGTVDRGCSNRTYRYLPHYVHSTGMVVVYILCYVLVLLLCVVGNGLVSFVILSNRKMRSVTNLFILNLAISDLLIGVFCIPTTLTDNLISGWPFDQITCTMSNLVQGMSVSSSVFTLVVIAVDRFKGIMLPFRHRMRPTAALLTILFIWLLAFAIICPSATTMTVVLLDDTFMVQDNLTYPISVCFENWSQPEMRQIYTVVIFLLVYLVPLSAIIIMYSCIAVKLFSNLRQVGEAEVRRVPLQCRAKVLKMLIMVAVLFMVSWLPLWSLMLLTDYGELDSQQIDFLSSYLFPAAHWLAFLNSAINPIIYGLFNENFRRGFQAAVACRPFKNKVNPRPSNRVFIENAQGCPPAFPKVNPRRMRGILLEDINTMAAGNRVCPAWVPDN